MSKIFKAKDQNNKQSFQIDQILIFLIKRLNPHLLEECHRITSNLILSLFRKTTQCIRVSFKIQLEVKFKLYITQMLCFNDDLYFL